MKIMVNIMFITNTKGCPRENTSGRAIRSGKYLLVPACKTRYIDNGNIPTLARRDMPPMNCKFTGLYANTKALIIATIVTYLSFFGCVGVAYVKSDFMSKYEVIVMKVKVATIIIFDMITTSTPNIERRMKGDIITSRGSLSILV